MSPSMSGSDRFDIATGTLSVLLLVCALVERVLPWTRLQVLEKRLKHTEADLADMCEQGLLGEDCSVYVDRLSRLRRESDALAARVHAASNTLCQFVQMATGLSCSLIAINRRVAAVQAEMALRRTAAYEEARVAKAQEPQRGARSSAVPPGTSRTRQSSTASQSSSASRGRVVAASRHTAIAGPAARVALTGLTSMTRPSLSELTRSIGRPPGRRSSSTPGRSATYRTAYKSNMSRVKSSTAVSSQLQASSSTRLS